MTEKNIIKESIKQAKLKDPVRYSNTQIAYAVGVSESALSNYCSGCRQAPPEFIVSLSSYLYDLPMRDRYCAQVCPIGRCKNPNGYTQHDLQTLGYMSGKSITDMTEMVKEIGRIFEDGKFDRNEQLLFKENNLSNLYIFVEVARNLINVAEGIK